MNNLSTASTEIFGGLRQDSIDEAGRGYVRDIGRMRKREDFWFGN